mgnify:CR=1 FL=1
MDIIQLLPDSVANQIAAGEVIQRPASVIKELVENSIDAGAKHIKILVCDAGKASIQVIDDGKGMSDTDARLSFERHATSKIRQANDLFALHTMGFRGEALASIAAVAQVTLQTRTADDEVGTRLVIAGSKVLEQDVVSCPVGSNFLIENLFFNIPARRKFLKSNTGLVSRFNKFIEFPEYSNEELLDIFRSFAKKAGFQAEDAACDRLNEYICGMDEMARREFGNARGVRNLFEKIVVNQANRVVLYETPTLEQLSTICECDVTR